MSGTPYLYSNALEVHRGALELIDKWLVEVHSSLPSIEPESDFGKDRQRCPEAYPGFDAWDYISQAVDHLGALRMLLGNVIPTHAAYTLLRAAMENAALAFWIAGPDDSDTRIARCLKLDHEDARQAADLLEYLPQGSWTGRTPREKKAALASAHKVLGLPGNPAQRFGFRSIMKTVGEESGINRLIAADRAHPSSRVRTRSSSTGPSAAA